MLLSLVQPAYDLFFNTHDFPSQLKHPKKIRRSGSIVAKMVVKRFKKS